MILELPQEYGTTALVNIQAPAVRGIEKTHQE